MIYKIFQRLKYILIQFVYLALKSTFKIKSKKVILYSRNSSGLDNNNVYLENELIKKDFQIVKNYRRSIFTLYHLATSEFVVVDDYVPGLYSIQFRKGSKFIQLWHAPGMFKKIGYQRNISNKKSITHKNYTDVIVSSTEIVDLYSEAFGIENYKIKPLGLSRTDYFFNKLEMENDRILFEKKNPAIKNKIKVLFAPTFRGTGKKTAFFPYEKIPFEDLYKNFNETHIFFIKMHPFIKTAFYNPYPDMFIIMDRENINRLLNISDLVITDYSSIIFEYSFFRKPLILFAFDYCEYKIDRGLIFDLEDYNYGRIVDSVEGLILSIRNPIINLEKIEEIQRFHMNMCDGNSTKRIVEEIFLK